MLASRTRLYHATKWGATKEAVPTTTLYTGHVDVQIEF